MAQCMGKLWWIGYFLRSIRITSLRFSKVINNTYIFVSLHNTVKT
jgi:hypothetical protein